jgi:sulfur-oxidizing protein SoxZ
VFAARLEPAIAANPYLAFSARLERSGTMLLRWVDDHGVEAQERVDIRVV